ncbi:Hint domain-containing protein [uncultured Ruegeria sp.]|uniref:Hint domain-containing protein n=1 Tax=uncultured Ruegeria sp. TaxID=259304 RepID=UPI002622D8EF|nr:Hint domain-containing protein [uncultured Ruegeria sp.]
MPDYELYVGADFDATGTTVALVAGYDGSNDTLLTVQDGPLLNDNVLDGDSGNNEVGDDPDQFGVATLAGGTTVGSISPGSETTVYSETQFTLTAPGETTITLYAIEIEGQLVGYLPSTPMVPGVVYNYTGTNTVPGNSPVFDDIVGAVCFNSGTLIETLEGPLPIEALSIGDLVRTQDGPATVRWIGSRLYDAETLSANSKLRPIRIVSGAMGNGLPLRDLLVSPQHRMLVSSRIIERVCGATEALISAVKLTELPGIFIDENVEEVEYFHILFDKHEVIFAEGCPSESLYTGPEALKALSQDVREEIFAIFPELAAANYQPKPARTIPDGSTQKQIVARHLKNNRALLLSKNAHQSTDVRCVTQVR